MPLYNLRIEKLDRIYVCSLYWPHLQPSNGQRLQRILKKWTVIRVYMPMGDPQPLCPGLWLPEELWRRAGSAIVTSQLPPLPEQESQSHARGDLDAWSYWKDKDAVVDIQQATFPWLVLLLPAGTVQEKLGSQVTPGEERRVGPQLTVTQTVSGLVRELGCVKSQALVR